MADYILKLQEDLKKRLDQLCWMHNEQVLHVAEHFSELRRQVDLDAEMLLSTIQSMKRETGKTRKCSDVNGTRIEFIRILEELEKRTGHQPKPQIPSSETFSSLEQRVDAFKDSSSSLDDVEDSYIQLAREIIAEIDRVEKRILGEQTIIYWLHEDETELGSLVYFGDVFLDRQEIDSLILSENEAEDPRRPQSVSDSLLVPSREPNELSKRKQVIRNLADEDLSMFARECKFFYVAKTEEEYSGFSAEGSSLERKFVSYQEKTNKAWLYISECEYVDTSASLFDAYSSTSCQIEIGNRRLESLHVNLLPSPPNRLIELILANVHFDSFDMNLLATFTDLTGLALVATFSKSVKFYLAFLGALRNLESLNLALPDTPSDLSAFQHLTELKNLCLEGTSFFYAEKLPKLSKRVLKQILSPPLLQILTLSCLEIEIIDREMLSECKRLKHLDLSMNRISSNSALDIGFHACYTHLNDITFEFGYSPPKSSITLFHSGIQTLSTASFTGMSYLQELSLEDNSITDPPPGVFDDLSNLQTLVLDKNLIRHVRYGVFDPLRQMKELRMRDNPIESIEANAFDYLCYLAQLSLSGCRLKSIDSEMFVGLDHLISLSVDDNLIERIEVVAEDGRRINVAKADLNDAEKELVKKHLFKRMVDLAYLNLSQNKLKKLDLNCFSNLKSLQKLNLSSNKINELSGEIGSELLHILSKISLNENQLITIENTSLPKNIYDFDLSTNRLKRLDEDFFTRFKQLETINLAHNELSMTITDATFASCRQCLREIDLLHNESISAIPEAFLDMPYLRSFECEFSEHFASMPLFKTLRIRKLTLECLQALQNLQIDESDADLTKPEVYCLSNCSIEHLMKNPIGQSEFEAPVFSLSWLPSSSCLKELDLSRNLIETLNDPDLFADFESIAKINLSDNRLNSIHRDIFKCLPCLETIDLSGNNLSSIDMGLFRHLANLKDLDLSSNSISFLNLARVFRICPSLQSLTIADNQLDDRSTAETIDARFLCDLKKLVLANNRLETMDFVRDMTSLQHLDLRGNQIESVMSNNGENLLGRLFPLMQLDLSENQIRSLTDDMFNHLCGRLEYLDISSNPLDIQLDSVLSELI